MHLQNNEELYLRFIKQFFMTLVIAMNPHIAAYLIFLDSGVN